MSEKIIELAKKLNELAKRGVDGEKNNATRMLKNLLDKHGISLGDIESDKITRREFKVKNRVLFSQVLASCLSREYDVYRYRGHKGALFVELTDLEYIEIDAKYNFYQAQYTKELKKFVKAFIMKNHIYPQGKGESMSKLTQKELEELYELMKMASGINKSNYLKQLTHAEN